MWLRFKSCCNIGCRRIGFFVLKMIKSRDHVVTVVVCKESMRFIIITLLYVAVKMFVALGEFFSFNFCCCKTSKSIVWNLLQCFFLNDIWYSIWLTTNGTVMLWRNIHFRILYTIVRITKPYVSPCMGYRTKRISFFLLSIFEEASRFFSTTFYNSFAIIMIVLFCTWAKSKTKELIFLKLHCL